jgi:peptide deformylase
MPARQIAFVPDPILRKKAQTVTKFDTDLQVLIDDMVETMREAPGVGLAAPQVGIPLRVAVIEYPENDEDEEAEPRLFTLINPEITRKSTEVVSGPEGCLSMPGYNGEVERHEAVTVKALNRRGQPATYKAKGWLARIFQHEIDHLNGVLYTDRATKVWKLEPADEEEDSKANAA